MKIHKSFQIPDYRYDVIKKLITLVDNKKDILIEEINGIPPTTLSLTPEKCSSIAKKLEISDDDFSEIFDFLLELYYVYYIDELELTIQKFVDIFQDSLIGTNEDTLIPQDWEIFKGFLGSILEMDETLGIIAKARTLRIDHSNIYQHSRILTDIRPIFTRDLVNIKPSAVIFHNLRIFYVKKGLRDQMSIALDFKDLKELKKVIDKAIQKEKGLQNYLKEKEINYLTEED